jgi:hypothetical protein
MDIFQNEYLAVSQKLPTIDAASPILLFDAATGADLGIDFEFSAAAGDTFKTVSVNWGLKFSPDGVHLYFCTPVSGADSVRIHKYTLDGTRVWRVGYGGTYDNATGLEVDAEGYIYTSCGGGDGTKPLKLAPSDGGTEILYSAPLLRQYFQASCISYTQRMVYFGGIGAAASTPANVVAFGLDMDSDTTVTLTDDVAKYVRSMCTDEQYVFILGSLTDYNLWKLNISTLVPIEKVTVADAQRIYIHTDGNLAVAINPTTTKIYDVDDLTSLLDTITMEDGSYWAPQTALGDTRRAGIGGLIDLVASFYADAEGCVESVARIPGTDEDEIWVATLRTIDGEHRRYIERLKPRQLTSSIDDCFFVDCGITVENDPASSTVSGLDHLEGATVTGLVDGVVMDDAVVSSGAITVEIDNVETAVSTAHIGLPFTYKLQPMRPTASGPGGTTHTAKLHTPEMGISFLNAMNAQFGVSDTDLEDINWDDENWVNTSDITGLFTGDIVVHVDGGFTLECPLIISGSDPLPCTVRALIPRLDTTSR